MSDYKTERDAACLDYLQSGDVELRLDLAFEAGWDACLTRSTVARGLVEAIKLELEWYLHRRNKPIPEYLPKALKAYSEAVASIGDKE